MGSKFRHYTLALKAGPGDGLYEALVVLYDTEGREMGRLWDHRLVWGTTWQDVAQIVWECAQAHLDPADRPVGSVSPHVDLT